MKEKLTFKPQAHSQKMSSEELQNYLQMKRRFNGSFKTKKDYNRQSFKKSTRSFAS